VADDLAQRRDRRRVIRGPRLVGGRAARKDELERIRLGRPGRALAAVAGALAHRRRAGKSLEDVVAAPAFEDGILRRGRLRDAPPSRAPRTLNDHRRTSPPPPLPAATTGAPP